MPQPIRRIDYNDGGDIDFSSIFNSMNNSILCAIGESSKENSELLYKIWKMTSDDRIVVEGDDIYIIVDNKNNNNDIIKLKTAGYVNGGTGKIKLTSKGKKALLDQILAQSNKYKR